MRLIVLALLVCFAVAERTCDTSTCWCTDSSRNEIIGSRRLQTETQFNCTSIPTCLASAHLARTTTSTIGRYVPQCNDDGSFSAQQCLVTGECWCVTSSNQEVSGTRKGPTETKFDCSALPKCLTTAHQQRAASSQFISQCNSDGTFQSKQCNGTECWCVDSSTGNTISTPSTSLECSSLPACVLAAYNSRNSDYVPSCGTNGDYASQQCDTSNNCWCVTTSGTEIIGTRTSRYDSRFNCANVPACLLEAHTARTSPSLGRMAPQCLQDGTYSPRQCRGSTGTCWCVSSNGLEISGTRRDVSQTQFDCEAVPNCLLVSFQRALRGEKVLACQDDGSFSPRQCDSTGNCWCVIDSEVEVVGSRRSATQTQFSCDPVPACLKAAHLARLRNDSWVPECNSDGTFAASQRDSRTNQYWCVATATGLEISGTRTSRSQTRTDCSNIPACLLAAHNAANSGNSVPQCDSDGSFRVLQCDSMSGHCWCVTSSNGLEIANTRRTASEGIPYCTQSTFTQCQVNNQRSNVLGAAVVQRCESDGSYSAKQCDTTTKECWCVDASGMEILNTRGASSAVNCTTIPPCFVRANAERSSGRGGYVTQCTSDGQFIPLQCNTTGECWCVNTNGTEIEDSRSLTTRNCTNLFDDEFNYTTTKAIEIGMCVVIGLIVVALAFYGRNMWINRKRDEPVPEKHPSHVPLKESS